MRTKIFRLSIVLILFHMFSYGQSEGMVRIEGARYIPLYGRDSTVVEVKDFDLDVYPVTNSEYLDFVREYPKWQKSKAKAIFADGTYLRNWKNDLELNDGELLNSPVTYVSWFAAKSYCECQGKRLPTMDEWEFAAMADQTVKDARVKKSYNQQILSWYEAPRSNENTIGENPKNYWGVYDLHGLVWEWTSDFNSVLLSGESRKDNEKDNNLFCGSASLGATDLMNYAAFMRYAFRGSIKANYAIKNLGFRCATDVENTK
jgi:sulfatase modifying factor 1